MNGGVGYSWFKLTLVDEARNYTHLTATMKEHDVLQGIEEKEMHLEGIQKDYSLQGVIQEQVLTGVVLKHRFTGTLGGGEGE